MSANCMGVKGMKVTEKSSHEESEGHDVHEGERLSWAETIEPWRRRRASPPAARPPGLNVRSRDEHRYVPSARRSSLDRTFSPATPRPLRIVSARSAPPREIALSQTETRSPSCAS